MYFILGMLRNGVKDHYGDIGVYTGTVNKAGQAHGEGTLIVNGYYGDTYISKATFRHNVMHGQCK